MGLRSTRNSQKGLRERASVPAKPGGQAGSLRNRNELLEANNLLKMQKPGPSPGFF